MTRKPFISSSHITPFSKGLPSKRITEEQKEKEYEKFKKDMDNYFKMKGLL